MCDKGGGLIARGSTSCIVRPNIPCKGEKLTKQNKKKVSKIVYGKKSTEYTNREKKIDDIIKKIPGHKDWSLIFDKLCKPPSFSEAKKIDKGLYDCIDDPSIENSSIKLKGNKSSKKRALFDEHSIMLIGDYGGETMETHFEKEFDDPGENIKIIEKKFIKFMKKLDELFFGLVELKNNGISHLDVKPNNIVLEKNGKDFKFIDFGLSAKYDNVKHFKKRAINEENTKRLYLWYPPEFLFSQTNGKKLKSMEKFLEKHDFKDFRNNADTYKEIYNLFNRDAKLSLMNIFNNYLDSVWVPDFNSIITKLDVYSLGMLIPILFYNNDLLERIGESEMLKSFFSLFDLMTVPLYIFRIDIENAYILYKGLMEKYSKRSNKSQKKSNKALKKSKKKSKNKSKKNKSKKLSKKK